MYGAARIGDFVVISNYRLTSSGWAIILLSVTALALGGCGRKGGLDLPPNARAASVAGASDTEAERAAQPGVFNPAYGSEAAPAAAKGSKKTIHPRPAAGLTERAMNHFDYRNGVLHAEAVNLSELADAVGTPFYCYSTATLERHYRVFTEAFAGEKTLVCYAMKANSNQSVLRTLAKLGAGADVVSGGELKRALAAGIPPGKILFSGVGKTEAELRAALAADILCINVESEPELELLSRLAVEAGKTARISVRVNPDVDAGTHAKIATGKSENKFGVPIARAREVYARAAKLPGIEVTGTDMHIGSQITDLEQDGNRVPDPVRFRADAARRRPQHLAYRFRRRARHSLSRRPRSAAAAVGLCRDGQAGDA